MNILEICCGSYEDALIAHRAGAKRIELNQALYLGGLTPSLGTLKMTRENTDLEIVAMVRPRGAGFLYSQEEFDTMLLDCELILKNDADGIAFGFLTDSFTLDKIRMKSFVDLIHSYHKTAVLHRAFDCTIDPYEAVETCIELGVDRILTSGLQEKAMDGAPLLRELQEKYGECIEFLIGSGVNVGNAKNLMQDTGIHQLHASCRGWEVDPTTAGNGVSYSYAEEMRYEKTSAQIVVQLLKAMK